MSVVKRLLVCTPTRCNNLLLEDDVHQCQGRLSAVENNILFMPSRSEPR
jgi:hypothetical protein